MPWEKETQQQREESKAIRNERKVITNDNTEMKVRGGKEKHFAGWGNKTGTGLAENEVTRRGNSPGIGSREKIQRGVERKGGGLEEKSRQIFVPRGTSRREKSANQEKTRPVTAKEFYSRRGGHTLSRPILWFPCFRYPPVFDNVYTKGSVSLDVSIATIKDIAGHSYIHKKRSSIWTSPTNQIFVSLY